MKYVVCSGTPTVLFGMQIEAAEKLEISNLNKYFPHYIYLILISL